MSEIREAIETLTEAAEDTAEAAKATVAEAVLSAHEAEAMAAMHAAEEATKQARIAANAQIQIAELQSEEPSWLSEIRNCLSRIEVMLTALSTPPASEKEVTVVMPPPIVESPSPQDVGEDGQKESLAEVEPLETQPEENQKTLRRRWI